MGGGRLKRQESPLLFLMIAFCKGDAPKLGGEMGKKSFGERQRGILVLGATFQLGFYRGSRGSQREEPRFPLCLNGGDLRMRGKG